jgi:hypothetical protein
VAYLDRHTLRQNSFQQLGSTGDRLHVTLPAGLAHKLNAKLSEFTTAASLRPFIATTKVIITQAVPSIRRRE